MRTAKTVLGILRERGKRGLPLERVYRLLFNRNLYLLAYGKIDAIIDALRFERYRWTPARRTYVPKANGKRRPLGLPSWSDKLLQEVLRLILDAYYDPQFSRHSHGFRRGHGCHTAL